MSLGAVAVIAKPFYPAKLAETVRRHMQSIKLASAGYDFAQRLRADAAALATFRDGCATARIPPSCRRNSSRSSISSPAPPAFSISRP